ncbi:hypothetical protein J0895_05315 [Phormidium pseudopriestleyi FRX01]|uniref:Uncharacterized protein n=1 Tax=Phormidium pseudopriestleyi FRX01 TaxID=1759528 RepID=A0ABS3FNZ5_9CYAN|nr:hypothetical protein [Phormidium pseudopriestleyi]MBO0348533.1 hypothetical protein [Phormidium pseudopriestleyi FRX01]
MNLRTNWRSRSKGSGNIPYPNATQELGDQSLQFFPKFGDGVSTPIERLTGDRSDNRRGFKP